MTLTNVRLSLAAAVAALSAALVLLLSAGHSEAAHATMTRAPQFSPKAVAFRSAMDKLWEDLHDAWESDEQNYFLGSIITAKPRGVEKSAYLDVVDGQQRLTTLQLLLDTLALGSGLAEARGDDDDAAHAGGHAVRDRAGHQLGTHEHDGQLDGSGHLAERRVRLAAEDLRCGGVNGIERPVEAARHHAPPAASARLVRHGGGADDGGADRIEERIERMPHPVTGS